MFRFHPRFCYFDLTSRFVIFFCCIQYKHTFLSCSLLFHCSCFQFQKPKGPTKKVPRKQKSLTMSDKELSQQTTPVDVHTPIDVHTDFEAALNAVEMHNDVNNNASKDNVSNGSDKENQLQVIPQADIKSPVPKLDLDNRNHSAKKRAEIHEDVIQPSTGKERS